MIYLASPYSHEDPAVVEKRVQQTIECVATLLQQNKYVWSPIVHNHELAHRYNLPTDAVFWFIFAMDFIRRADGLYVLTLPGWKESKGVRQELDFATDIRLPITFLLPEDYLR